MFKNFSHIPLFRYKSSGKGTQYDCVLIPGASKKDDSAVLPGIFGGSTLATATGASKMGTICCKYF